MNTRSLIIIIIIAIAGIAAWQLWPNHEAASAEEHEEHSGEESEPHDEGESIQLSADVAKEMGIEVSTAQAASIADMLRLTGQITLNQNSKADVKARFPGVVREVKVQLGEQVEKGQILARVESNDSLQVYNVTAPLSGTVLARNTNPGDVAADMPLFTIADLSSVWAEFYVFPRDLGHIKKGLPVIVRKLEHKIEATDEIILLLPTADAMSQTVTAIVKLPNPEDRWRPGMTVEGNIVLDTKQVAVAIPPNAIQRLEDKTIVFVREEDRYSPRTVTLGKSGDNLIEITSGLAAGETFVTKGSFILKSDLGKEDLDDEGH